MNLLCLPFHHPGTERDLDSKEKRRRCQWNAWRHSNPTVNIFGKKMAAMEGAEAALGVASGMAAIACAVEQVFRNLGSKGGHLIASRTVYGGTYALFKNVLPDRGIEVSFKEITDLKAIEAAIRPDTKNDLRRNTK